MDLDSERQRLSQELVSVRQNLAQYARREAHLLGGLDVLDRLGAQAPAPPPPAPSPQPFAGVVPASQEAQS